MSFGAARSIILVLLFVAVFDFSVASVSIFLFFLAVFALMRVFMDGFDGIIEILFLLIAIMLCWVIFL